MGLSVLLLPLAFAQLVPSEVAPEPSQLTSYLSAACNCLAGVPQSDYPDAECEDVWYIWLMFLLCNVTYDVTSISINKHGSATMGQIWSSFSFIATIGLYQWPWLTGLPQTDFEIHTMISVLLILSGLAFYGWHPEERSTPSPVEGLTTSSSRQGFEPVKDMDRDLNQSGGATLATGLAKREATLPLLGEGVTPASHM